MEIKSAFNASLERFLKAFCEAVKAVDDIVTLLDVSV